MAGRKRRFGWRTSSMQTTPPSSRTLSTCRRGLTAWQSRPALWGLRSARRQRLWRLGSLSPRPPSFSLTALESCIGTASSCCMGSLLPSCEADVDHRISLAWHALRQYRALWRKPLGKIEKQDLFKVRGPPCSYIRGRDVGPHRRPGPQAGRRGHQHAALHFPSRLCCSCS
eukprot:jgi/Mesvir1/5544/Mv25566-RA.1